METKHGTVDKDFVVNFAQLHLSDNVDVAQSVIKVDSTNGKSGPAARKHSKRDMQNRKQFLAQHYDGQKNGSSLQVVEGTMTPTPFVPHCNPVQRRSASCLRSVQATSSLACLRHRSRSC